MGDFNEHTVVQDMHAARREALALYADVMSPELAYALGFQGGVEWAAGVAVDVIAQAALTDSD